MRKKQMTRNEMIASVDRLVISLARGYVASGAIPFEDLVQEGRMGAVIAANQFKNGKGKYAAYATPWIRSGIMDCDARHHGISKDRLILARAVRRIQKHLRSRGFKG